jgi:hypothetical protein
MDAAAFGADVVAAVRSFLEQEVDPLLARIDALEKQLAAMPAPKDGVDGKSVTLDDVAPLITSEVEKAIAAIPMPKDGENGANGQDGASFTAEDAAPIIAEEVAKVFAGIRQPEDGRDGKDGKDADPELMKAMIAEAVAALPPAEKGKDADPEETAALVQGEVKRAVASLPVPQDGKSITVDDVRPLIDEAVTKAVALIPVPKDGVDGKDGRNGLDAVKFFRDDKGHLIVVKSDGSTDDLGEYIGKDGAAGERGKDGADGVGFDDMSCEVREDGVYLVWEKGDLVKEARLPIPMDRGVYKEGHTYRAGDGVTWGGSFWIAQTETTAKPDMSKDWRLSVKRGRDGKDADQKPKAKPDTKDGGAK